MIRARPFRAEDLAAPADVGDEHGGRLVSLETDHQVILAVGPHDRPGTLVVRFDLPPQVCQRPSYLLPTLSRTRHTFPLLPKQAKRAPPRYHYRSGSLRSNCSMRCRSFSSMSPSLNSSGDWD